MTSTIHEQTAPALLMALELGRREWKVGFGSGARSVDAAPDATRGFLATGC